jgi:peptidoglycan/LPS O-acetylase OafA/YrhL
LLNTNTKVADGLSDLPSGSQELDRTTTDHRVRGLDAMRFVAAIWVVLSHVGAPRFLDGLDRTNFVVFALKGALGVLFCGPAAVMIFFVISGFCIHYPYAAGIPFKLAPYLVRRYIRIALPMLAAMVLSSIVGDDPVIYFSAVLWSLVAELMYYTIYPLLRMLLARVGMNPILAGSYAVSVFVVLFVFAPNGFAVYGWGLNWLVGLPCWLLGVKLAGEWSAGKDSRDASAIAMGSTIWKWRLFVWALSSACSVLNFHSPIGYAWTLPWFALVAFAWLRREIARANCIRAPWAMLEWAGTWSYSIYLVHMPADSLLSHLMGFESGPTLHWLARIAFILVSSLVFYALFEAPSHRLARWASRYTASLSGRAAATKSS